MRLQTVSFLKESISMNDVDILNWMVLHRYAKNEFSAYHIFKGLKLSEVARFWERVHRVMLYRRWRKSGIYPEKDTASCYVKAIAGERVGTLF